MTETSQEERDQWRESPAEMVRRLTRDADRLAQYERDLHDDIGKDRSQDTDWLRAGFLQRGAEIERLEDGIRALAEEYRRASEEMDELGDYETAEMWGEAHQRLVALLDGE